MKKKAFLLFLLRIFKLGLNIITLSVTAKYFGISISRDHWILALNCILVIDMALWGPINETFRAKFVFMQHEIGSVATVVKTKSVFTFINLVTFVLVGIILTYPRLITRFIAPDYDESQLRALDFMMMVIAPSFLLNQVTQFFISVLNSFDTYYIPEISSLVSSIVNIVLIVTLAPYLGIYSLACGYYFSIILLFVLLRIQINKLKLDIIGNPLHFKFQDVKPFLLFALPFFFPYFLGQINLVVEKAIASTLTAGAVSVIDYSRKFSEIVLTVLQSIYSTMLLPVLSQHYARKKFDEFYNEFKSIYQLSFLIIIMTVGIFTTCPMAVVNLLYNKGSIETSRLLEIGNLCTLYSWASLSIFLYLIFGIALLSTDRGKTYAILGAFAQILMIILNLSLKAALGVYAFPISLLTAHFVIAIILYLKFPIKNPSMLPGTIKGIVQVALCTLLVYLANKTFIHLTSSLLTITVNCIMLVLINVAYSFVFKTDDRFIFEKLINRLRR